MLFKNIKYKVMIQIKSQINYNSRHLNRSSRLRTLLSISILLLLSFLVAPLNIMDINDKQTLDDQVLDQIELECSTNEENIFKLIYGTTTGPFFLDPADAWDAASFDVINQVCEGLFTYNLSDSSLPIIPQLAADFGIWSSEYGTPQDDGDGLWNYTVSLRTDVFFHDDTEFNASAVKWSFDRLMYFIDNSMIQTADLYKYNTETGNFYPIINQTLVIDTYSVRFVLNKPYGLFEALLCFSGSSILSPFSTPAIELIDTNTGDLVGTGPFVYDYYISSDKVKFHAFENYWNGKANVTVLEFSIIPDSQNLNDALLSGEVDVITTPLKSMFSTFESDPDITLSNAGLSATIQYLNMNNHLINSTFRKAISYAINYSYIIDEIKLGYAERLKSPIPSGILFGNNSLDVAIYNVTKAREFMQIMGFGLGWDTTYPGINETEWSAATFTTFNYTYNIGNSFREDILLLLQNNLDKIGIEVTDAGMSWADFLYRIFEFGGYTRDMLDLYWFGLLPDYNDPSNFINNLFTNRSIAVNGGQYNGFVAAMEAGRDPYNFWDNVQLLMEAALFETDQDMRKQYYDRIQQILVEEDMPVAYGYQPYIYDAYRSNVIGFKSNFLSKLNFYSVVWNSTSTPQPIYIDGNTEWQYFKDLGKCTGQGTLPDPYIIEDLVIDGVNNTVSCIRIENSDVYFKIENCTLFNSAKTGIELINVSNSQIIGNNCSNNNFGIFLDPSTNNEISGNIITNNGQYGIILDVADNNLIYNNTIIGNNINAFDNGSSNNWDNGVIGNFWSDYEGVDTNNDGIGEIPYFIPGVGSQDNFPKCDRYYIPGVNEYVPLEQIIKVGLTGDLNHFNGDHNWKGAFLAATEINEAGGVLINGSIYYIGLKPVNTYENEVNLNITKGLNAVNELISDYSPHFIIGGQRNDSVASYIEPILDAQIPFITTGVATNWYTQKVLDDYDRYKYLFRTMPLNVTALATDWITFDVYLKSYVSSLLGRSINKIAFLYEQWLIPYIDVLKTILPSYGFEIVKEILINSSDTIDDFTSYWNEIDNAGAQFTSVGFGTDKAILMSQTYSNVKPRCLISGINVYAHNGTYWDTTSGGCNYEITYQNYFNVPQTPRTIPFYNSFVQNYTYEPLYTATGAYDAINLVNYSISDTQSFDSSEIVLSLETINSTNPFPGAGGYIAFTQSHSLLAGINFAHTFMCQWQSGGNKVVLPNSNLRYLDTFATGSLQIPSWGINLDFTINTPIENNSFADIAPAFNIEILDTVDTMWYSLDGGATNFTITANDTINQAAWTALDDGNVMIMFYANDLSGHIFTRYVNVTKDTVEPDIVINSPISDSLIAEIAPSFNITVTDLNLDAIWYSLDGGLTNFTIVANGTINQVAWTALEDGPVTIIFYSNDSARNISFSSVDIVKDANAPNIVINSPIIGSAFTEIAPSFNITVTDLNLDAIWYSLDGGLTNFAIVANDTINQAVWTALADGIVNIRFYSNDTLGHVFNIVVGVIKDTQPPIVTIEPMETDTYGSEAPTIILNITDVSDIILSYYTVDGGLTKYTFTGNVVTINQTLWDALKEGEVTIVFYLIDSVERVTTIYVPIYKDLDEGPSDIMWFYIIIGVIAGCLGIASTIAYTQYRKRKRRKTDWVKLKKKKGLLSPEFAEGKNIIFISYATADSDIFQIPFITDILIQYPEIDDILYWESDMHDDIYEYMDDNLKLCEVFLLFCSENSFYSEPVKMEWRSALKLDKKIIPIFINPNDIPPLLTTKLGVQFNENEVYDSIEGIYQMILKKLEIMSIREFCNYLIPKSVSEEFFEEITFSMIKKDIIFESDILVEDLKIKLISIIERNSFELIEESKDKDEQEKSESGLVSLKFFAEEKFGKQEIGLLVSIQKVDYYISKVYLRIMGNKEWMINAIINDLNNKLFELKSVTELLRDYSENIKNFINQTDNLEDFFSKNLGIEIKNVEDILNQYLDKQILIDEFIKRGVQILGKPFLLIFIESLRKEKNLNKKPKDSADKTETQSQ